MRRSLCRPRRSKDCMRTTSSWPPRLTAYSLGRCQRHRLCVLKRRKRGRAPPPHLSSHPAPDEFYNDPLSFRKFFIRIAGYTEDEKVEIARKHLIPHATTKHGLDSKESAATRA